MNDILMESYSKDEILKLKEKLNGEFDVNDLGSTKTVVRINIKMNREKRVN
jgi:hypothetical protein